jgi:hypothetical protein
MSEKRKPKGIDSQMSLDTICGFVKTISLRINTRITGIFYRLGVNDD